MDLTKEEIPTDGDTVYLLSPPSAGQKASPTASSRVIVLCIDISGSMGVTSEVSICCYPNYKWYPHRRWKYGGNGAFALKPLQ